MKKFLKALKSNLLLVYQAAIWLLGLISPLIFMPGYFSDHIDGKVVKGIAALLVTVLITVCYLFFPNRKSMPNSKRYILLAAPTLVIAIITLFTDIRLDQTLTVEKPAGSARYFIVGSRIQYSVAMRFQQRGENAAHMAPRDLVLQDPTDDINQIYFQDEIDQHAYQLIGAYYLVTILFVLSLILTAYALLTFPVPK